MLEKNPGFGPISEGPALKNISMILMSMGRFDKALEFSQKALKMEIDLFGEHPRLASILDLMGNIYF